MMTAIADISTFHHHRTFLLLDVIHMYFIH